MQFIKVNLISSFNPAFQLRSTLECSSQISMVAMRDAPNGGRLEFTVEAISVSATEYTGINASFETP
jgi:hypothetical protein